MKLLALTLALVPIFASAQSAYPIQTDRPSFGDGPLTVPKGHWQIEMGTTSSKVAGTTSTTLGEVIARFYLSNMSELRITNVTWTHVPGSTDGFQDPTIGTKIKLQVGSTRKPDFAVELQTTIPSGAADFRVNRSQPTAKFIWNQNLDATSAIGGNIIASDLGPSDARFTQWAESIGYSKALNSLVGMFAEAYRLDPIQFGVPSGNFYDVGVTYLLNKQVQLDARYGAGFNPTRDGTAVGVGISYRY